MGGWGLSTIPTNCTPDFVAFDVAGRIHLIESKGTLGKFDYRGAASGLGQAVRLQAFNFSGMRVAPATRNVCATYFRSCAAPTGGAGEAVRTCVLHYPEVAGGGDVVPANRPIRIRLAGLYALGAWASLQALAQQQHEQGAWHIFAIPAIPGVDENDEINGWHIRVGLSAHLNDMMNQFNQDVIRSNAPLPTAQFEAAVQNIGHAVLALDHPPDDQPMVPPPEGMDPVSGDSWICIGKA